MASVRDEHTVSCDKSVEDQNEGEIENSPEALFTQIGIEETNIKTIGVSGTKPKVQSGSLTERQSHLLMLSQNKNFESSSSQVQTSGPLSLPNSKRFENPNNQTKVVTGLARAGTVDHRGLTGRAGTLSGLQQHTNMITGR